MAHYLPDFVVVIHPALTSPDAIIRALRANKAVALNVMTYPDWLNHQPAAAHNLLCLREDGGLLYARNDDEKAHIRRLIESLSPATND